MRILLTNDDGIYAPGLAAMERALRAIGEVTVVAPAIEQSGVGHSITFLTPLMASEAFDGERQRGWAVEGSPADCVKLAIGRFCKEPPDLIVSGINGGFNIGINVLYSGTVAGATEGALFGIPSVAVSLEWDERPKFDRAASLAVIMIEQIVAQQNTVQQNTAQQDPRSAPLYNINIPTVALERPTEVRVVPMATARWPAAFEERLDPKGRRYYWASGTPPKAPPGQMTDLEAISQGFVTITPLRIDRTEQRMLETLGGWKFSLDQ